MCLLTSFLYKTPFKHDIITSGDDMKRSMYFMIFVFVYTMLLRILLSLTLPLKLFGLGIFIDALVIIGIGMFVTLILRKLWMQKVFYSLFVLLWTIVGIADYMYHGYFGMLTTRANAQGLSFMSAELTVEYDLAILPAVLGAFLVFTLLLFFIIRRKTPDVLKRQDYGFLLFLVFVHVVMLAHFNRYEEDYSMDYYQSDTFLYNEMYDTYGFASDYGYYYYHLLDLLRLPNTYDDASIIEDLNAYFDQKTPHQANAYSNMFQGANVIQITVESFDTRFIDPVLTPTLYTMLNEGYRFDNYYVPTISQGATCNSEFMALTSLYAYTSHAHSNNVCYTYQDTFFPYSVAAQLNQAGYNTYYFHSGYAWFYQRETLMPNMDFETVKFIEDIEHSVAYDPLLDTNMLHFMDQFVAYETPFYINLLTYGLHGGYQPAVTDHHNPLIDSVHQDTLDESIRVYLQKMIEFDIFLAELISRLQAEGVYDDTLFTIYTDHYPFMLDKTVYESFLDIDTTNHELYQQSLILYHPDMEATQFDKIGSTIDVAPTLLNLVYADADFKYFFGQDLFSNASNYVLLPDLSIIDGDNRYYLNKPYQGDSDQKAYLKARLELYITNYLRSKHVLRLNFFDTNNTDD